MERNVHILQLGAGTARLSYDFKACPWTYMFTAERISKLLLPGSEDVAEMEAPTMKTIERAGESGLNKGFVRGRVKPMPAISDRQSPREFPECMILLYSPLS